jgi:hypothetical protein
MLPEERIGAFHPVITEVFPAPHVPHAVGGEDRNAGGFQAEMISPQLSLFLLDLQRRDLGVTLGQPAEDVFVVLHDSTFCL